MWRLKEAPIEVNGIIPYIVHAFSSPDTSRRVSIESAVLTWGKMSRPVDLVAKNFKIVNAEGNVVASIPEMSLSFSLLALLRGTIAPKTIAVYNPYLHLFISKEGKIKSSAQNIPAFEEENIPSKSDSKEALLPIRQIIEGLQQEDYISEFSLINAKVKVTDQYHNAVWDIPSVNLIYEHKLFKNTVSGTITLKTETIPLTLHMNGIWGGKKTDMILSFNVKDINLSQIKAAQKYTALQGLTTPVNLDIKLHLNLKPLLKTNLITAWRDAVQRIEFDLNGGAGTINLPAPVSASYDLKNFTAKGVWYDSGDKFDISSFGMELQTGRGFGNIAVQGIGKALDTKSWESISATMNATALDIPVDKLPLYWPASITTDVHDWVKDNMHNGMITEGTFALHFAGLKNEPGIDCDKVQGTVNVIGSDISYMEGMPPVNDVSGVVKLTRDVVDIDVYTGHTFGVNITGGQISFYDLIQEKSNGKLNLNLAGNLTDALKILDQPPLGFTKDMGIVPEKVTGTVSGNLQLSFPIGDAFTSSEQIQVKAAATISNASVNDIVLNYDLANAAMDLTVEGKDVNITGTALFFTSPSNFKLYQSFDKAQPLKTKIDFNTVLNNETRSSFDYGTGLLVPPTMDGNIPATLVLTEQRNNTGTVQISMDMTNINLDVTQIGWQKPSGIPGKGQINLQLADSTLAAVPFFSFSDAQDSLIQGQMTFKPDHAINTIEFNPVKTARTNAKARIRFINNNQTNIDITGASLDLTGVINNPNIDSLSSDSSTAQQPQNPSVLNINAVVDKIWLSKTGFATNNALAALRENETWKKIEAVGHVGGRNIPFNFNFYPTPGQANYTFNLTSGDAGNTLHAMDYISSIKGGKLQTTGIYTPGTGSKGILHVSEFRMTEMPIFTRILMLTSFTGIVDLFKGEGLVFDSAEVPYVMNKETITIKDAVIAGPSLGITLNGKFYLQSGYLNLRGSLIPFYTINSLLGRIPLIGKLFAGEKGGGLIAPTYTVKGTLPSPDISVNALSALAPGVARELFDKIISDEEDHSKLTPALSSPEQEPAKVSRKQPASALETKRAELPPPLIKPAVVSQFPAEGKVLTDSLQHKR